MALLGGRHRTAAAVVSALALLAGAPQVNHASSEYTLKAAFLYNFARFVTWPDDAFASEESPLLIGIVGEDPFGTDLDEVIADKTVHDRPLQVWRIRNLAKAHRCHVLFISFVDVPSIQEVLRLLKGRSVLTVGDAEGFTDQGGMIEFFTQEKTIRFEINGDAAEKADLKISSKLLRLGRAAGEGSPSSAPR